MLQVLRCVVIALSLSACVLISVFWVRSYWWRDQICRSFDDARIWRVISAKGRLQFTGTQMHASEMEPAWLMSSSRVPTNGAIREGALFQPEWGRTEYGPAVPHLFVSLAAGVCAAVLSRRVRFSLRGLLAAMTLIAVLLGLAVLI
jgi:hypothetical protein